MPGPLRMSRTSPSSLDSPTYSRCMRVLLFCLVSSVVVLIDFTPDESLQRKATAREVRRSNGWLVGEGVAGVGRHHGGFHVIFTFVLAMTRLSATQSFLLPARC